MELVADASVNRLICKLRRAKKRRATVSWSVPVEIALMVLDPGHLSRTRSQRFGIGFDTPETPGLGLLRERCEGMPRQISLPALPPLEEGGVRADDGR
eukprot:7246119-Pyramimonas_sp.AAC.1